MFYHCLAGRQAIKPLTLNIFHIMTYKVDFWSFAGKVKPGNGKSRLSFVLQAHPKIVSVAKIWLRFANFDSACYTMSTIIKSRQKRFPGMVTFRQIFAFEAHR